MKQRTIGWWRELVVLLALLLCTTGGVSAKQLTLWSTWALNNPWSLGLIELGKDFEAKTGIAIKVEVQSNYDDKLPVALAAGAVPDVIAIRGQYVDDFYKLLIPMTSAAFTPEDCPNSGLCNFSPSKTGNTTFGLCRT